MRSIQLVHTYQTIVLGVRRSYEQWPNIGPNLVRHTRSDTNGQYSCGQDPGCRDWSPPPAAGQEIIIAKVGKPVADLGPLASPRGKRRLGTVDLGAHKLLQLGPSQHDELSVYRDSGRPEGHASSSG